MPYPNEHSARVKEPGAFQQDSFRRKNIADGIDAIMGKLKGEDTMTIQAYRFDKSKFTPEEAKKWLKDHDISYISFEAASEEKSEKPFSLEIRSITYDDAEVRAAAEDRMIEGYGIVFNKESRDLGGFTEVILPEAVEGVIERSDILALMNHDITKGVLARCTRGKGSMKVQADKKGVRYSFRAPKFNLGNELLEGVERGDIRASSFAFTLPPSGGERWDKLEDGRYKRTILQFDELFDMSPCYREAYEDTTVARRSIEELRRHDEPGDEPTKPDVVEVTPEPIVELDKVRVSDLELEWRIYKQKQQLKEL
jgi:HK97 family phage prohead protease